MYKYLCLLLTLSKMNVSQFAKKMTNSIVLLVFFSIPLISLISQPNIVEASSPYHGNTWYVSVGAQSPDGSAQVFAFYPSIIVIDVNDTVVWTLTTMEPHTVTFLSGHPPLNPLNESNLLPIGGNIYNGTGIHSSGLMVMGQQYNLTFTKPGVYPYYCELHPGMTGIVVVQPAGTPYPYTQQQYNLNSSMQEANDVANLISSEGLYSSPAIQGANNTYTYYVTVGPEMPLQTNVKINPVNNSGVKGQATISFISPFTMMVQVNVSGLAPNSTHQMHIHLGTCQYNGPIQYYLNSLVANSKGYASSTTVIHNVMFLPNVGWYINIHQGANLTGSGANPIACGNVVFSNGAFMTFYPSTLTIHVGDRVVWTQVDYADVHTVTFVPPGMQIPEFGSPMSVIEVGNNSQYNGSGYYNSGVLLPFQTYTLTFTKPGIYTYVCLIHDSMGMIGQIVVLPKLNSTTITKTVVQPGTTVTQQYTTTVVQQSTVLQPGTNTTVLVNQTGTTSYIAIALGIIALIIAIIAIVMRR
jgi:plastocyanin